MKKVCLTGFLIVSFFMVLKPSCADIASTAYVEDGLQEKVAKAGDELIDGIKTFNDTPLTTTPTIPSPDPGMADGLVTNSAFHNAMGTTVRISGNQSVSGVKTFTDIPLVPTAPLPQRSI